MIKKVVEDVLSLPTNSMVVLVDVSHDYNGSSFRLEELNATGIDRMLSVLKLFESGLREISASSSRVAYVEGEAPNWGDRILGTQRQEFSLGGPNPVKNGIGNEPFNRTLLDGHASTINNGLWLQSTIQKINMQFGTGFTPILDAEIADLVDLDGSFGIAPEQKRYSDESIQLSGMPDQLHVRKQDLPYDLPQMVATSAEGLDVTNTITAYLEEASGTRLWLHGSGREISLRSTQIGPGDYKLVLRAQDRYGNRNKWHAPVVIYD